MGALKPVKLRFLYQPTSSQALLHELEANRFPMRASTYEEESHSKMLLGLGEAETTMQD